MNTKQFLTIGDLAERYGLSKPSIYNYVRSGKLPRGIYIGGAHRWPISEIEAFEARLANSQEDIHDVGF